MESKKHETTRGDFAFPTLNVLIVIPNFSRMFFDIWSEKPYMNLAI